jgi:hypothetical protein
MWMWSVNPFVGTKPYQGLLVTLVLLNSSDLKTSNNRAYTSTKPDGSVSWRYIVRDLGTSLGQTGRFDPAPNKIGVFERQPFIDGVEDGYVMFHYHAVHKSLVQRRITPDDVRWACRRLAALSSRQWHDAFRAGGYEPELADRFIQRIRQKVDEGLHVP